MEEAIYIHEGGQQDSENDDDGFFPKLDVIMAHDKCFLIFRVWFIGYNLVIQTIFFLYQMKVGINQDQYECKYEKDVDFPCIYGDPKSSANLCKGEAKDLVNVTYLYDDKFQYLAVAYLIFDFYIIAKVYVKYFLE